MTLKDKIFQNHYNFYTSLGVETIKQQSSQFLQVEEAYQGRAVNELIQNAIDRADNKIIVELHEEENSAFLIVANDGNRFSFHADYDYREGSTRRYDFQSLCSIATSTKNASIDIGNKGVGFKAVFSLNNFANIYTNGIVYDCNSNISEKTSETRKDIDFRLYDQFNEISSLGFIPEFQEELDQKLINIKQERNRLGIPGYYFPQQLLNREGFIQRYFEEGMVTVVAVPLPEDKVEAVRQNLLELKNFQFYFIPEKQAFAEKEIKLAVVPEKDNPFFLEIKKSERVISHPVSPQTKEIGRKAGIDIDSGSKVSIYLRPKAEEETMARLYNYLPTEMYSPFANIDINADFHTKVDRKSLDLGEGEIGRYNAALLRECFQLIKDLLIEESILPQENFDWRYVNINTRGHDDTIFREVFLENFASYSAELLKRRMIVPQKENYHHFYNCFIIPGINYLHQYYTEWQSYHDMLFDIGGLVRKQKLKFLPDITGNENHLFYRRKSNTEESISLPEIIGIGFTSYFIDTWHFKEITKGAEIKDFDNTSEVYRLFWQCNLNGEVSREPLSDDLQVELLYSIYMLMMTERSGVPDCAAWRYATIPLDPDKDIEEKTRGAFALSSLFYKKTDGKYYPAQCLCKNEIDNEFLERIGEKIGKENVNSLLLKTGVSLSRKYCYADQRIHSRFKDGLNYIPALLEDGSSRIIREEIWRNVSIVYKEEDGKELTVSPAAVNENYKIFINFPRNKNNTNDFNALYIGKYDAMPVAYNSIIKERLLQKSKDKKFYDDFLRFNSKYYLQLQERDIAIVKFRDEIRIMSYPDNFYAVSNSLLFDENIKIDIPLLMVDVSEEAFEKNMVLQGRRKEVRILLDDEIEAMEPHEDKVYNLISNKQDARIRSDNSEDSSYFDLSRVEEFLADPDIQAKILVKISQSKISERDFELNTEKKSEYYQKLRNLKLFHRAKVKALAEIDSKIIKIGVVPYLIQENEVYVTLEGEENVAQNNISKALSMYVFNTERFSDIFELVMFSNCFVREQDIETMRESSIALLFQELEKSEGSDDKVSIEERVYKEEERMHVLTLEDIKFENIDLGNQEWSESDFDETRLSSQDGIPTLISHDSVTAGFTGEHIAASLVVRKFMEEFPDNESREKALEDIDAFLSDNSLWHPKMPEDFNEQELLNYLWYTRKGTKPFDIITIDKDHNIKMIEVKTTRGANIIHFSKRELKYSQRFKENYEVWFVEKHRNKISRLDNLLPPNPFLENRYARIEPKGYDIRLQRLE